jgi:hypothetical protein
MRKENRHTSALLPKCACNEDLMRMKSRLWNSTPSCGHGVQNQDTGTCWDPFVHAPPGVPRGSTTDLEGMERSSWGGGFSNWNCMLYNSSPFNRRPDTHTHTHTPVRETGDVIARTPLYVQLPSDAPTRTRIYFGSQVTRFSRDPSSYSTGSYVPFLPGRHMQKQYHQRTT